MRIFAALQREIKGLHEAAYLLGLFAVFSQILALLRDRLLAHSFGAGEVLDVYFAAFRIPDLIFAGIASVVSVYVLIPFISERLERSPEEARAFISSIFSFFLLSIGITGVILFLAAPYLLPIFFSGIPAHLQDELLLLTRVLLLQPIFLGLSSLLASITQTYRKFLIYALSPLLYNVGIILGIVFLYPLYGIAGLGIGVVFGAILHLAIQVPFIIRSGVAPRFARIHWREARSVMRLSLPRTIALSATQIALLVLIGLASRLEAGSVAIFNLAFNLQFVPLSIIGVSYSVAAFPTLARLYSSGEQNLFFRQITTAARHIIFWSLPVLALFIILRAHIVRVILGTGEFDWADTRLTAAAVALFIISLAAHGLMLLLVRGYYAAGNTKTPVIVNTLSAVLTVAFSYGLLLLHQNVPDWQQFIDRLLRVDDLSGTAVLMLPLGYALAMIVNATVLLSLFQRDFRAFSSTLERAVLQSFSAAVLLSIATHQTLALLADTFDVDTLVGIFLQGFLAGVAGLIVGVASLALFRNRELAEAWGAIRHRVWRQAKPVVADELEP